MSKIERVVLIEPRSPGVHFFSGARMPSLGLPILGAILRNMGLNVKIFCENLASINWREIANADLVGISVFTNLAPRAYEIAAKVRQITTKAKIVMGGPHVTFLPEEALGAGADFVVRHEGEETLPMLVKYLQGKGSKTTEELPGLSWWNKGEIVHNAGKPLVQDLDRNPLPDFSLIEGAEKINFIPIQTSRGCPYDCEFCSVTQMFGHKIRYRSPESIVKELNNTLPGKHIFIVDDNFSANSKRTLALLEAMRKAGIKRPWSTQERVEIAWKKDILKLMRETNCIRLYQGIESFNPESLEEWNKKQTPEQIKEAISILHQKGFLLHGMFIFGAEADNTKALKDTFNSAIRCKLDTAQFFALVPAPGTRLYKRLHQAGRIFDRNWSHYGGQHVVFEPKQMNPWELQELVIEATREFYTYWRGLKWGLKLKGKNAFFAGYGKYILRKWLKENEFHLTGLKRRWAT